MSLRLVMNFESIDCYLFLQQEEGSLTKDSREKEDWAVSLLVKLSHFLTSWISHVN